MKIHCIGIGGIGVSALAQYYLAAGHKVSGSDLMSSEITDFLKKKGVKIIIGHRSENIKKDTSLVIYSPAVTGDNPELLEAKIYKIKTMSYPEALGELTKIHFTIAIAGAHGKSTTTAMVGLILLKAGLDPTVVVGTKLKEFGKSNFRMGKSKYLVIEACEYDGSFLNYDPKIIVITNIDKEHLDYFKTFGNVKREFLNFILKLKKGGFLVLNDDDKYLNNLVSNSIELDTKLFKFQSYSLKQSASENLRKILKIPGSHNVSNALAALAVARILKIPDKISLSALSEYKGSWRRFEILKTKPYTVISDYGHHPNEISATLKAARERYSSKKIWLIFQPHQRQRTHYLFNDFVKTFRQASINEIIITDIYDVAGREEKNISSGINSEKLVNKINKNNVKYMSVVDSEKYVKKNIKREGVLIIMGAGDIYKLADSF